MSGHDPSKYGKPETNGAPPESGRWLHPGEIEAQRRFGVEGFWDERSLDNMFHDIIPPKLAAFLEGLPFFFIATADDRGACDCSFRGREHDAAGRPCPLLKVIDRQRLVFPDYSGNNLFNSLGNILVNGHIGMLFIDFQSRIRMRLNGAAEIFDDPNLHADIWPLARRYVQVTVEQVYGNCQSRIPKMILVPPDDNELQDR